MVTTPNTYAIYCKTFNFVLLINPLSIYDNLRCLTNFDGLKVLVWSMRLDLEVLVRTTWER